MNDLIANEYAIASVAGILAVLLLAGGVIAPTSDSGVTQASVTINTFVDITLTPCAGGGAASISYGSADPATTVTPVNCHNSTHGDLRTIVEATTNTPVNINISGTDYDGPGASVIAVEQTKYDDNVTLSSPTAFTETPTKTTAFSGVGGTGTAVNKDLYFSLDVPGTFLAAGTYASNYTVSAS